MMTRLTRCEVHGQGHVGATLQLTGQGGTVTHQHAVDGALGGAWDGKVNLVIRCTDQNIHEIFTTYRADIADLP